MVESSLFMREVRGSMPRISNFSEEPGNQKKEQRATFFSDQKKIDMCVQYATVSVCNRTELAEKAIAAPNRQSLPYIDVEENITLLIRESKTSLWVKQRHWTPPARHVNRNGKRWYVRKTWIDDPHQQSQSYNDMHKKTLFNYCINRDRFDMALAHRVFNGDVAQMVRRSLSLQEVRG